ncbi:GNAT family N-acetyltransferase [Dermabacter jinjuensis]|uniref:GNAT family N-acetyltransferase n=1 Tax=Dermabacter jinjuensis TaxID=1667168 RepID=UPI001D03A920|nr:GNAT family N-acetyltransferase [Dermabacter jinjuensis]UEB90933.1 GNAT family N-acetyltransferase [Dermabacter jinjuensis]
MRREQEPYWPVRLRTERLHIREPGEADRGDYVRLMTDPSASRYLGGAVNFGSRQALELSPLGNTWGAWIIAHGATDHMLGIANLSYDRDELEINYALLPEFVGHGYAREAVERIIEFARDTLDEPVMIAVVQTSNKRSVEQLKRIGFRVRRGFEEFGSQQLLMEYPLHTGAERSSDLEQ